MTDKQLSDQLDTLMIDFKNRINQVMEEDGEDNESRSEALCEEWWEWITHDDTIDVVFVPKEFQTDLQLYLDL